MAARPLLHLCSRATTFFGLSENLIDSCQMVSDWDHLLVQAEEQGIAPLLDMHIKGTSAPCPIHFRRGLHLLSLRHRHINHVFMTALREILQAFKDMRIDNLVLKGAALCQTVYPAQNLRPMRDIDLLVRPEKVLKAQELLREMGFHSSGSPQPDNHFHLSPLHKIIDNIDVCIELHFALFPHCPPYYKKQDFPGLFRRSIQYTLAETEARTLGNEDMLYHVFHHGFRMPLTYAPFKLISVADVITLCEKKIDEIDWKKIQAVQPEVFSALPLLHFFSPWQENIMRRFSWDTSSRPAGVGEPFRGWPQLKMKQLHSKTISEIISTTFWPSEWWCRLYYAIATPWEYYKCRLLTHPLHVFWWIRLYSSFLLPDQADGKGLSTRRKVRRITGTGIAMIRKIIRKS